MKVNKLKQNNQKKTLWQFLKHTVDYQSTN